ncbi:hypothetical protein CHARACLAT_030535 [Characodon lateralis]|uniref:Uncharacterized protein n=1 Tax=Characodon lateralis TaxID=208331 RepID=A0ABU7EQE1_9TELE|nr:hypothetical protein [Characodon lateralis]
MFGEAKNRPRQYVMIEHEFREVKPSDSHKFRGSDAYLIHKNATINALEVYRDGIQNRGAVLHNLIISGASHPPQGYFLFFFLINGRFVWMFEVCGSVKKTD